MGWLLSDTCLIQWYYLSLTVFVAGLGEFRIRDLNDEINKLLREKRHWEARIKELGGPDYNVSTQYNNISLVMYMSTTYGPFNCGLYREVVSLYSVTCL